MSRYLKSRELCPIHNSYFCTPCHKPQKETVSPGRGGRKFQSSPRMRPPRFSPKPAVMRVEDSFHPRGFREVCSDSELHRRKVNLISQARYQGTLQCLHCGGELKEYDSVDLAHKIPKGMGGSTHDDHYDNLGLAHSKCNAENGSKRVA